MSEDNSLSASSSWTGGCASASPLSGPSVSAGLGLESPEALLDDEELDELLLLMLGEEDEVMHNQAKHSSAGGSFNSSEGRVQFGRALTGCVRLSDGTLQFYTYLHKQSHVLPVLLRVNVRHETKNT